MDIDKDSDCCCGACSGSGYYVDAQGDHQDCRTCLGTGYPTTDSDAGRAAITPEDARRYSAILRAMACEPGRSNEQRSALLHGCASLDAIGGAP